MSQPMYSPPPPPAPPPPPTMGGAGAAQQVQGPATGLLVVGALGVIWQLISLAANIFGVGMAGLGNIPGGGSAATDRYMQYFSGGMGIVFAIIALGLYGFAIWAALQMKQLRKWNISVGGAIAVMLPCSCCCLIGLPIGIWALIVLMKPEVKSAFSG